MGIAQQRDREKVGARRRCNTCTERVRKGVSEEKVVPGRKFTKCGTS